MTPTPPPILSSTSSVKMSSQRQQQKVMSSSLADSPSTDPNLNRLQQDTPNLISQIIMDKAADKVKNNTGATINSDSSNNNSRKSSYSDKFQNKGGYWSQSSITTEKSTQTNRLSMLNIPGEWVWTELQSNNNNNYVPANTDNCYIESTLNSNLKVPTTSTDTDNHIKEPNSNIWQIPSPELQMMVNTHTNAVVKRKNSLKYTKSDNKDEKNGKQNKQDFQRKLVARALQSFAMSNNKSNNNRKNSLNKNQNNFNDNSLIISNKPAITSEGNLPVIDLPQKKKCSPKECEKRRASDKLRGVCNETVENEFDLKKSVKDKKELNNALGSKKYTSLTVEKTPGKSATVNNFDDIACSIKITPPNAHSRNVSFDSHLPRNATWSGTKRLNIEKSILDWMHKRYCAEQYQKKRSSSTDTVNYIHGQHFVQVLNKTPNGSGNQRETPLFSVYKLPKSTIHLGNYQTAPPSFRREFKHQRIITNGTLDKGLEKRKREKLQAEIEAKEACKWLRYTGFPQYAQMFQDGQFPINTESVHSDHDFLDPDSLQALSRRLDILNRCSKVQIDTARSKTGDDSDEEEQCALSDKWKYQRSSRRWSRMGLQMYQKHPSDAVPPISPIKSSASHDSLLTDQDSSSHLENSMVLSASTDRDTKQTAAASLQFSESSYSSTESDGDKTLTESHSANVPTAGQPLLSPKLGRATSFRPARILISRFGSKKNGGSMRNKKQMDCLQISGPIVMETDNMKETIRRLNCIDLEKNNKHSMMTRSNSTDCSSSGCPSQMGYSSASNPDIHQHITTAQSNKKSELFQFQTQDNYSDNHSKSKNAVKNNNSNNLTEVYLLPSDYKPGSFPKVINNGYIETGEGHGINFKTGSFNIGHDSKEDSSKLSPCSGSQNDRSKRVSIYDNVPLEESVEAELDEIVRNLYENITGFTKYVGSENSFDLETEISLLKDLKSLDNIQGPIENEQAEIDRGLLLEDKQDEMTVETDGKGSSEVINTELSSSDSDVETEPATSRERLDSGVGSSLTRPPSLKNHNRIRWYSFQKSHRPSFSNKSTQICTLSVGQIRKLQSVCMLTITTLMEKFSPANRSGWNWTVSRFIKKVKEPDYKDKKVFGVPLIETLRRSGQPVPQCILYAMKYLRSTAKDADGIFRRSGVKSRIQNIREQIELNTDMVAFNNMQSYDVADLTKQYFRELPECLLTNKLSEMFIGIFTHFPKEHWLEAVNATIILMPDENREVLQSLLLFLHDISKTADHHKMTASNLAVCFAPSLFNVINLKSFSSPSLLRNKKQIGVPDSKEVLEPAHECLVFMIDNSKSLFSVPQETIAKCRLSASDINSPREMKDFDLVNGKPNLFIDKHYQVLFKECREKFRNWNVCPSINGIDIAYKKTDDLLRQWLCLAEMEAPPEEVLNRILTERSLWDEDLNESNVVEQLDNQTDIFQYTRNSMPPHPCRHYCLIRSWRTDLSKGACLLLTHSVRHPNVKISGVEGVILESHYLIEPCGAGKSRVTHIIREDTKGRSVKWYNLSYGKINANFMDQLRTSFQQIASGPETKL